MVGMRNSSSSMPRSRCGPAARATRCGSRRAVAAEGSSGCGAASTGCALRRPTGRRCAHSSPPRTSRAAGAADVDVKVASGDVEFEDVSGEAVLNAPRACPARPRRHRQGQLGLRRRDRRVGQRRRREHGLGRRRAPQRRRRMRCGSTWPPATSRSGSPGVSLLVTQTLSGDINPELDLESGSTIETDEGPLAELEGALHERRHQRQARVSLADGTSAAAAPEPPPLLRQPEFLRLGPRSRSRSSATRSRCSALPLVAVSAYPGRLGGPDGLPRRGGAAAALLFSLLAYVWIERPQRRRHLMIVADVGRAVLLALCGPIAYAFDALSFPAALCGRLRRRDLRGHVRRELVDALHCRRPEAGRGRREQQDEPQPRSPSSQARPSPAS